MSDTTGKQPPTKDEIRAARLEAGLGQAAAAALIYCSPWGWQKWEGGKRDMHPAFWELWQLKVRRLRRKSRA